MNNLNFLLDRPIAFNRAYVMITGDTNTGLFLSQFMYWSIRSDHGWFYKTRDEWIEETTLSRFQIERARKKLVQLNLISEERRGLPRKVYYKINLSTLNELLGLITPQLASYSPTSRQVTSQPVGEFLADQSASFSPSSIQENTTENTTENINTKNVCLIPYQEILDYLNSLAKTNYRVSTKANQKLINARWKEGFRLEDFKKVMDNMTPWLSQSEWAKYYRPQTLFSEKFESYLNTPAKKRWYE